jgi:hypothetical protein
MRLREFDQSSATVTLTAVELRAVNNALNEVCNGVRELADDGEFSTRMGVSRDEARELLADVAALIKRATALPG